MTDTPDTPYDPEEDITIHSRPLSPEYAQLLSAVPIQASDPDNEAFEDTFNEDNFKTAGIKALLPNALAKEERSARLRRSRARRRSSVALTADEIQDDLNKIMLHLSTHLSMQAAGLNVVFKLPAQAILYAERKAFYAITDYPRVFENDMTIMNLWDTLERIYITALEWRKDEKRGNGRRVVVSIERMAKGAIRAVVANSDEVANNNLEDAPRDSQT